MRGNFHPSGKLSIDSNSLGNERMVPNKNEVKMRKRGRLISIHIDSNNRPNSGEKIQMIRGTAMRTRKTSGMTMCSLVASG